MRIRLLVIVLISLFLVSVSALAQDAAMTYGEGGAYVAPDPAVAAEEVQATTIEKAPLQARLEALRTDLRKTNDDIQLLVNRRLMLLGAIEVLNEALK